MSSGRGSNRRSVVLAAVMALGACRARSPAPTTATPADASPAAAGAKVTVSDANARPIIEIEGNVVRVPDGDYAIRRDGDAIIVERDGAAAARLAPGPSALSLTDAAGQPVARVVIEAGKVQVIAPDGVAILRAGKTAEGATASDAGGVPLLVARATGSTIALSDRDGATRGSVSGTADPVAALILATDRLPVAQRLAVWAKLGR